MDSEKSTNPFDTIKNRLPNYSLAIFLLVYNVVVLLSRKINAFDISNMDDFLKIFVISRSTDLTYFYIAKFR